MRAGAAAASRRGAKSAHGVIGKADRDPLRRRRRGRRPVDRTTSRDAATAPSARPRAGTRGSAKMRARSRAASKRILTPISAAATRDRAHTGRRSLRPFSWTSKNNSSSLDPAAREPPTRYVARGAPSHCAPSPHRVAPSRRSSRRMCGNQKLRRTRPLPLSSPRRRRCQRAPPTTRRSSRRRRRGLARRHRPAANRLARATSEARRLHQPLARPPPPPRRASTRRSSAPRAGPTRRSCARWRMEHYDELGRKVPWAQEEAAQRARALDLGPAHVGGAGAEPTVKYNSTSSLYIDSTISKPCIDEIIFCARIAIHDRIHEGEEKRAAATADGSAFPIMFDATGVNPLFNQEQPAAGRRSSRSSRSSSRLCRSPSSRASAARLAALHRAAAARRRSARC